MQTLRRSAVAWFVLILVSIAVGQSSSQKEEQHLPSSKTLQVPAPGAPKRTNSFPTAIALSPDGKYLAILNNGYGTAQSKFQQSIALLDLGSNQLRDFPDARLGVDAKQTYFLGLAWSSDGSELYASMASLTDPEGKKPGDTGNGIAVYQIRDGVLSPERFLKLPLTPLGSGQHFGYHAKGTPKGKANPYPAGLAAVKGPDGDALLIAENLADDAVLLDAKSGRVLQRFPLGHGRFVPSNFPYGVVATRDGARAWCSLWNGSAVAELDLRGGKVARTISLLPPKQNIDPSSHATALLLSPDESRLYVALANRDALAVMAVRDAKVERYLDTRLPGQTYGGTYPNALAQSADGKRLYVANASSDAVAVFDVSAAGLKSGSIKEGLRDAALKGRSTTSADSGNEESSDESLNGRSPNDASEPGLARAEYFIPTEWYPTAVTVHGDELLIATGKGQGTGPNSGWEENPQHPSKRYHPYIATMIRGSIARVNLVEAEHDQKKLTEEVLHSNLMEGRTGEIAFQRGGNPVRHVIYIIKENRTYDQLFGDIGEANGDPSLVMYGESITPNQHKLARQFGVLDNFYDSGEVSGDGHVWSTSAITSDYTEKTWEIDYRGGERTYDYEGWVGDYIPMNAGVPDVNEPATGYLWGNLARHNLTYRNYGEFVTTTWCTDTPESIPPSGGAPPSQPPSCSRREIKPGEAMPPNLGGGKSAYQYTIPLIAYDTPTKPELKGHYDPSYADFKTDYPDQLRADEFLREFAGFVKASETGSGEQLPQFVLLRLPDDHTAGTRAGMPTPNASVADNDLAVGRVVEAVSSSPYWDDTAIFVLEDDAQNGADHVDAHRSIALVISKYAPGSAQQPAVDHHFYTTVNLIHTMEVLLGLPPMNNNDAYAPLMAPLFTGAGEQPAFKADYSNRDNGMIYQANGANAPGAKQSAKLDFSHADAADANILNAILWRAAKGNVPMPSAQHTVFAAGTRRDED
ncbi:MAG: beta-propeller fold lactonase family protein [Candidatus Korobacteraceae bacterium]